jgi:hypothetical protein
MLSGGGAAWLTRCAGSEGDPSLRLKDGSAQDDRIVRPRNHCYFWIVNLGRVPFHGVGPEGGAFALLQFVSFLAYFCVRLFVFVLRLDFVGDVGARRTLMREKAY